MLGLCPHCDLLLVNEELDIILELHVFKGSVSFDTMEFAIFIIFELGCSRLIGFQWLHLQIPNKVILGQFFKYCIKRLPQWGVCVWLPLNMGFSTCKKCDGIGLIMMIRYSLIGLHGWLGIYRGLLLIRLFLTKHGGNIGS